MAELARVNVAAAPACPSCRHRFEGLNLDRLSGGAELRCPSCGNGMRIPQAVLDRLIQQRDAALAAEAGERSILGRLVDFLSRLFR